MAYAFIDDGYPEADEYETNYIEFDASDPKKIRAIIRQIRDYLKDKNTNRIRQINHLYPAIPAWVR